MIITKKIFYDEKGEPAEVIIPYAQFQQLTEAQGWDLDETERKELAEALADSKAGNREAFVPASEI